MRKLLVATILCLALLVPTSVHAAVSFQYVTDASSYPASAGSNASVNVYLVETDTAGSTDILASRNGLLAYGFYVAQTAGASSGQSTISTFTTASPFTEFGTGVNGNTSSAGQNPSGLPANSLDYYNADNTQSANGNTTTSGYQVLVGTLTVTAGTQTTFTLTSQNNPSFLDPGNGATAQSDNTTALPASNALDLDQNGTANGTAYSGANNALYTFTVGASTAAVPEPSSMLLCGLFLPIAGLGVYLRRRRALVAV